MIVINCKSQTEAVALAMQLVAQGLTVDEAALRTGLRPSQIQVAVDLAREADLRVWRRLGARS
jgi:2-keto-3-deoxy-6-phosphogluconate aldolase